MFFIVAAPRVVSFVVASFTSQSAKVLHTQWCRTLAMVPRPSVSRLGFFYLDLSFRAMGPRFVFPRTCCHALWGPRITLPRRLVLLHASLWCRTPLATRM